MLRNYLVVAVRNLLKNKILSMNQHFWTREQVCRSAC